MSLYKKQTKTSASEAFLAALNANHASKDNPFATKNDLNVVRPYKVYTALLTQYSTSDPVATVLENTLGIDLVWVRTSTGEYRVDGQGVFTVGKSVAFVQTPSSIATFTNNYPFIATASLSLPFCYINVTELVSFTLVDSGLTDAFIEIRVYE